MLIERAKTFAYAAHSAVGQLRKYTNEHYFTHVAEVANLVYNFGGTNEMIAAAYLHDVVEDTEVTIEQIEEHFGNSVAYLVSMVTEVSTKVDGNRATRKLKDAMHYANGSRESQTIKLCDIISNVGSIAQHDPEFAKVYIAEKQQILDLLTKADPIAIIAAQREINKAREIANG